MISQPMMKRASTALGSELPTGFVLMDIQNGKYFALNETASEIWRALENPASAIEIAAIVGKRFEIPAEACVDKTAAFLAKLVDLGIVTLT